MTDPMIEYVLSLGNKQRKRRATQSPRCSGKCRGPSLDQWVKAGYPAKAYPPQGYAATTVPCCLRADVDE